MSSTPEPQVMATEYVVSILPEDHIDRDVFEVKVAYRGPGSWAVITRGRSCLGADGEWDYEMNPSSRTDEWLATHRFDLETALDLARKAAPDVTCNGTTAREVRARFLAEVSS